MSSRPARSCTSARRPSPSAVAAGDLAIVGATYHLADGRVVLRNIIGDVGEKVDA